MFLSVVFQDYRILVCVKLLIMIVIAGRLSLLGFVFKPFSWLAGDSRLRQTFSLRKHLVERQSLSLICPSTSIYYFWSPEASLSTSVTRSTAGPILSSLHRNKPLTPSRQVRSLPHVTDKQNKTRFLPLLVSNRYPYVLHNLAPTFPHRGGQGQPRKLKKLRNTLTLVAFQLKNINKVQNH